MSASLRQQLPPPPTDIYPLIAGQFWLMGTSIADLSKGLVIRVDSRIEDKLIVTKWTVKMCKSTYKRLHTHKQSVLPYDTVFLSECAIRVHLYRNPELQINDYVPGIYTDGSYSATTSIEAVFRPDVQKAKATASVILKDFSDEESGLYNTYMCRRANRGHICVHDGILGLNSGFKASNHNTERQLQLYRTCSGSQ